MIVVAILASALGAALALRPLAVPGGGGEIGFDDMGYSPALDCVLVPAGRTGNLDLVDSKTHTVRAIGGFSTGAPGQGHGEGTTSADYGAGLLFASDRTAHTVNVVEPKSGRIVDRTRLADGADYVRWVESRGEVWVTEPHHRTIEFFRLDRAASKLAPNGALTVKDGPESLVIDLARHRAYANSWQDSTYVIDLDKREVVATWKNGCSGARGLALDAEHGALFVGCQEGKAVALDAAHGGKKLAEVPTGKGVDIIAFSPARKHLYVPAEESGSLTVLGFDGHQFTKVATVPAVEGAHCAAADARGGVYVCDPAHGQLLFMRDE